MIILFISVSLLSTGYSDRTPHRPRLPMTGQWFVMPPLPPALLWQYCIIFHVCDWHNPLCYWNSESHFTESEIIFRSSGIPESIPKACPMQPLHVSPAERYRTKKEKKKQIGSNIIAFSRSRVPQYYLQKDTLEGQSPVPTTLCFQLTARIA